MFQQGEVQPGEVSAGCGSAPGRWVHPGEVRQDEVQQGEVSAGCGSAPGGGFNQVRFSRVRFGRMFSRVRFSRMFSRVRFSRMMVQQDDGSAG